MKANSMAISMKANSMPLSWGGVLSRTILTGASGICGWPPLYSRWVVQKPAGIQTQEKLRADPLDYED